MELMKAKHYAKASAKKVKWAVTNYTDWRNAAMVNPANMPLDERFHCTDLHDLKSLEKGAFAYILCKFITETITFNSEEYPSNSIKELVFCI